MRRRLAGALGSLAAPQRRQQAGALLARVARVALGLVVPTGGGGGRGRLRLLRRVDGKEVQFTLC